MGKKLLIFAGVMSLFQALIQTTFSSLSIAQYFCVIDFLQNLPNLLYIRILYYHNPGPCGTRVNIGQSIDGIANQAFVLLMNEPFTVKRSFIINCISLGLSTLWIIASCIILAGGARNEYSRPIRWPWITVTVAICTLDVVATVIFANDSFHTKTLNAIMVYIGGSVNGIGTVVLDTSAAAWIMVALYSRFVVFFLMNVWLVVFVALNKNISKKVDDIMTVESVTSISETPPAPTVTQAPVSQVPELIAPIAQIIDTPFQEDEAEELRKITEVDAPTAKHTLKNTYQVPDSRTLASVHLSNITEVSSNVSSTRDLDEVSNKDTTSFVKIPRAGFSQAFRNMKKRFFNKEHKSRRDSVLDSLEVSPERSPELGRILARLINNVNRSNQESSSVSKSHLTWPQSRPSLPLGWLVLSAMLSRSPRIQYDSKDNKRAVRFPEKLLSLPQRLENMIAEQQRQLDRAVIDTSGRASPPRASQSLPHLNGTNDEAMPAFNKSRRGTAAELQGQLPWTYVPAPVHRMRDQLPPDEDLPPVPLPDYTAIQSSRKASVHRAASSLSSLTQKKYFSHGNQLRNKRQSMDVLY